MKKVYISPKHSFDIFNSQACKDMGAGAIHCLLSLWHDRTQVHLMDIMSLDLGAK